MTAEKPQHSSGAEVKLWALQLWKAACKEQTNNKMKALNVLL